MTQPIASSFKLVFVVGILAALLPGCGGAAPPDGLPELHPFELSVSQGGTPVEGVSVQLVPEDRANSRWACGGATDAEGKVFVKTLGKFEGAPAGSYKVTFYKAILEDMSPGVSADDPSAFESLRFLPVD